MPEYSLVDYLGVVREGEREREGEEECAVSDAGGRAGHVSRVCGLDAIRSYSDRIRNVMKRIRS